ncbi:hypothetical protein [Halovenus carboxidivorans]|nr:hypothetical protein [Halovenus carboxidivorans]
MTASQTGLFDYEPDTPEDIIERVQTAAQDALDAQGVTVDV